MSRVILFLFILLGFNASAQYKNFIISVRGDTLNRVDLNGKKQGPWVIHMDELRGEPGYDEQGYFADDKKAGVWVRFSLMGDKIAVENFRWGSLNGKNQYFNRTGALIREETWRAIEPGKAYDTVDVTDPNDPSKVINRAIVKVEGTTVRHGVWTYYDPEWGTITKTENWFMDKLATDSDNPAIDDDLKPIDVTGKSKSTAKTDGKTTDKDKNEAKKPQAILDYEKKNSGKKKIKARDGSTGL